MTTIFGGEKDTYVEVEDEMLSNLSRSKLISILKYLLKF